MTDESVDKKESWKDKFIRILNGVIETNKRTWNEHTKPSWQFQDGVNALLDRDYATAFEYFTLVSDKNPIAMFHIGCMLLKGKGTVKDYEMGIETLKTTASCIPNAIVALGQIYERGLPGVAKDKQEALKWYTIAAVEDDEFSANKRDEIEKELPRESIRAAQTKAKQWVETNPEWNEWILIEALKYVVRREIEKDWNKQG